MSNLVRLRRTLVAGRVPALDDVPEGHLALNHADGLAYMRTTSGSPSVARLGGAVYARTSTPPQGALEGDRWTDPSDGTTFTLIIDAGSPHWVEL